MEPRRVSWLWPGRIPLGRITLFVGRPDVGKSFLAVDLSARVTTGTPWPDGSNCPPGSVILISAEDDPHDTIRPRLDAHCADVRRAHLLSAVRRVNDDDKPYERIVTLTDLDDIEKALERVHDCKLLIVDPIGSFIGGRTDAHRDNEVRGVLAPIAQLAEKYGPAVVVIAHRRKSPGVIADDLALGSRAFTGIARAVWHLSRDPDNKRRRLLLSGKNNLAAEGDGLAFSIVGEPPRIAWERERIAMSADDALAAEHDDNVGVAEWLRHALADGPVAAVDLRQQAADNGISPKQLRLAKVKVGAGSRKASFDGGWEWSLGCEDGRRCPEGAQDALPQRQGAFGHLGGG